MTHTDVRVLRVGDLPPYPELQEKAIHTCKFDRVVILQNGTEQGRATVALLVDLPDGSVAHVETTARMFETVAATVRGACQSWGENISE